MKHRTFRTVECLFWHRDRGRVRFVRKFRRSRSASYIARGLVIEAMSELNLPDARGLVVQAVWERPA